MPHPAPPPDIRLDRDAIRRMLRGLIALEAARATGRRIDAAEAETWTDALPLGEEGLGLDSLGTMAVAAAVDRLFQLHETGAEGYLLLDRRLGAWVEVVEAALAHDTTGLTFATSGSTGEPQPIAHRWATLRGEVAFWADQFRDRSRIVLTVPAHHIYGALFGALLPVALGVPVLERRGATPAGLARDLEPGDLLVGFPTGLGLLAATRPRLPSQLAATSSTGPLAGATAQALAEAGLAALTEIYGSSETAGIGFRQDPAAPFRLLPRWAAAGEAVREVTTGMILPLPDTVVWEGADTLRPTGRRDASVQVAGMNVYPARIARLLEALPGVLAARVRLDQSLPDPRLKAFLLPDPAADGATLLAGIRAWCAARLTPPERPVHFTLGPVVPVGPLGKDADWPTADQPTADAA